MQTATKNIQDPETWLAQGNGYLSESDFQNALDAYRRCLSIDPRMVEAHYNSGVVYHLSGDLHKAAAAYRTAIDLFPDLVEAHFNLGHALTDLFQLNKAVDAYLYLLRIQPDHFKAAYNLADIYKTMGDFRQAEHYYRQALRNKPDYAEAWNNMGVACRDQGQLDQAIVCFEQALAIEPEMARAWFNLGIVRHKKNEYEASLSLFEKALMYNPEFAPAHWHHALLVPMMYRRPEEIEISRQRYKASLEKLSESTPLETEAQRRFALEGVASTTNFHLQYQGADDTALQKRYGDFAATVMAANYPQWSAARSMPPLNPGGRLRIGYVSSLVYGHTIGIFLSGWIRHHDRRRFELFCYHVGSKTDELTEHMRKCVDHFHHIPGSLENAARQIENDALHVLIHTDVGMNPLTFQLAALRLAPVQCKGWGHPVTTGLPTMDYYLSSDLMEPPAADAHYSETLIRLPNLALCHQAPSEPDATAERDMFAIPGDRFVFLCSQSLFKYLPQHDHLYPEIALLAPRALFVFIAHDVDRVTSFFQSRLESSFARFGLTSEAYCQFVSKQNHAGFMKLNRCADLVLDSLMWSGGKSSLEALWCGTPVITLPGEMMRGRHTYAFLKRIGADQAIASDPESYIRIAARCATDREFLEDLK
ncbi:MAG: tetratricopeptide repeat protein, partial [Desulfosarcinaceae bacterium]